MKRVEELTLEDIEEILAHLDSIEVPKDADYAEVWLKVLGEHMELIET